MTTAKDSTHLLVERQTQEVTNPEFSNEKHSRFERFGRFATVLGFFVDAWSFIDIISRILTYLISTIAAISVLFATTGGNTATVFLTNIKLSPWHALIPWSLMTFCCLAFARTFYNDNIKTINKAFWEFILKDLLFGFNHLRLSLPIFGCIVMFVGILAAADAIGPIITAVTVIGGLFFFMFMLSSAEKQTRNERFVERATVDWSSWQQRIAKELEGKQWITSNDFKDTMQRYDVTHDTINTLMARYAALNPTLAKYGDVYTKDQSQIIAMNVLINKRSMPKTKYHY